MAKTTPSGRAKSKTKAPKKKPTQLDRIERSIGLIESKLATLYAWERLEEAMSNDKLASQTVAVEEKWVPKVNALAVYDGIVGMVDAHSANVGDWWSIHGRWVPTHKLSAPSPEEIASHEAKLKAEAQAAEDAKLVFGARVECEGREWYIASITPDKGGHYLIARTDNAGLYMSWRRQRNEFTLLP